MKTALFPAVTFSVCTSVAFADALTPAANAGRAALTQAAMDQDYRRID